jgi:hypothetical protein
VNELKPLQIHFEIKHSTNVDAEDIIRDITEGVDLSRVSVAGVFIAPFLDAEAIVHGLKGLFKFIGCTTLANYSKRTVSNNFRDETVSIIYLFDLPVVTVGHLKDIRKPGGRYAAFSLNDDTDDLIDSIEVFGGIAYHNDKDEGAVFLNGEVLKSGTVAVELSNVVINFSYACGWEPLPDTQVVTVTDADGLLVKAIDNQAATDFYLKTIHSCELFGFYPVKVVERGVIRTSVYANKDDGCIKFSAPIHVNEQIQVTFASRSDVLAAVGDLVKSKKSQIKKASFVFAVSCSARNHLLADIAHKEFEFIRELNPQALLVYLHGEFKPVQGKTVLENQHFILGIAE